MAYLPLLSYDWTRFWQPWEDERQARPATAYLPEMDNEWDRRCAADLRTLDALDAVPCLILLGEPGIGKTRVVKAEVERLIQSGRKAVYHDLKSFNTADDLSDTIFTPEALIDNTHFLDSLDEGLAVTERLAEILVRKIEMAAKSLGAAANLRIRIVCRSTEWPASATKKLRDIFSSGMMQVWHLCQLRRSDVARAASNSHWGQVPDAFLEEVAARGAIAFAAKPVTLDFLLQLKARHGTLPSRQLDLYRDGLMELCRDPNDWRQERRFGTTLPAERRFALARRIAVLSILCQKPFVARVEEGGVPPSTLLTRREIREVAGWEVVGDRSWEFGDRDLDEVLGSGLFRGIGTRAAWAHQTYAEFLAADYLVAQGFTPAQVEVLVLAPDDLDRRVVPQLHELAAWLAMIDETWRGRLIDHNADLLLRSDVAAMDETSRLNVAASYLQALDDERIEKTDRALYPRLAASGLAVVLRPFLLDRARTHAARWAAVDIAGQCRCIALLDDLITLASRADEDSGLRGMAMHGLAAMADPGQLARLLPLLDDGDDEVRGQAVEILWPRVITTAQALPALRPPQDRVLSHYNLIIQSEVLKRLPEGDLPIALRWIADIIGNNPEPHNHQRMSDFEALVPRLYAHAIARCDRPEVADTLADLVLALSHNLDWIDFSDRDGREGLRSVPQDDAARRDLVWRVICRAPENGHVTLTLVHYLPLVRPDDISWLIAALGTEHDPEIRKVLVHLVHLVSHRIDLKDEAAVTQVYEARQHHPDLEQGTLFLFGPFPIEGADADMAREHWALTNRKPAEKTGREIDNAERINDICTSYLDRVAAGESEKWWRLIRYLSANQSNRSWEGWLDSRMSSLWGCQFLTEETRDRFVAGAIRYLRDADPPADEWWNDPSRTDWRAVAGYRALEHLLEHTPEVLEGSSPMLWEKWAPVLVGVDLVEPQEAQFGPRLMRIAFAKAPGGVFVWLRRILLARIDSGRHGRLFDEVLKGAWSAEIGQLVAESLSRPGISTEALQAGMGLALRHDHPFASSMLEAAVVGRIRGKRRVSILLAAIGVDGKAHWPCIWTAMTQDDALAREILLAGERGLFNPTNIPPDHLAELFVLIKRIEDEDNTLSGEDNQTRIRLGMVSAEIINFFINTATEETLAGLARLRQAGFGWAGYALIRARENKRRREWLPPKPFDILTMAADREKRRVTSGAELLGLVEESLGRFQDELHQGPTPQRPIVWNTVAHDVRPKEENELSDVIVGHLRRDLAGRGIVTNREVEVRASRHGETGERTDIHIDAVMRGSPADVVTVVVEVKGCWHAYLKTAMRTQLVDRYLDHNGLRHGLYLVGWFLSPIWNTADARRGATEALGWDFEAVKTALAQQAASLSSAQRDVRAFVLDARWPGDGAKIEPKPKPKRKRTG